MSSTHIGCGIEVDFDIDTAQSSSLDMHLFNHSTPEALLPKEILSTASVAKEMPDEPLLDDARMTTSPTPSRPDPQAQALERLSNSRMHKFSSRGNTESRRKRAKYSDKRRQEVADVRRKGACFPCGARKVTVSAPPWFELKSVGC